VGVEAVIMVLTVNVQSLTDKIGGLKEQISGKIKGNPDLIQRGKDRRTGDKGEASGFLSELVIIQFCSFQDQNPSEEKEGPSPACD
jgi:hypothetical protein